MTDVAEVRLTFPNADPLDRPRLLRVSSQYIADCLPSASRRLEHPKDAQGDPVSLVLLGAAPAVAIAIEELVKFLAERGEPPPTIDGPGRSAA